MTFVLYKEDFTTEFIDNIWYDMLDSLGLTEDTTTINLKIMSCSGSCDE